MDTSTTIALTRFATSDLNKARRHGMILITGTKAGVLEVGYTHATKAYTIGGNLPGARVDFAGSKKDAVAVLVSLYTVVTE